MSDVIQFPTQRIVREIPPESIKQVQERGKVRHAEAIVDEVATITHAGLSEYGIDTDNDEFQKDFAFALEGLRAIVFRSFGIEHSLHAYIDKNVHIAETAIEIVEDDLPCDVERADVKETLL